ncbi:Uncharacterised protein [BD1-7 clade bacterium]|nr:Uncharacterised protein [BD1-7 clade bacterium]
MNTFTTYEYGYLVVDSALIGSDVCRISQTSFDWLKKQCLRRLESQKSQSDRAYRQLLRYGVVDGVEALQVRNYVGVISTPFGDQIEILPKIARSSGQATSQDSAEFSRTALVNMLKHLHEFRHIETAESMVRSSNMPLLEVFIRQFLLSVNTLVKRGLRSDYSQVQENQRFLKGRLLVNQQLRHNSINKHKFFVEYDNFLPDRPVNRLLHSALVKVANVCRSESNQRLCRELRFVFAEIPVSRNVNADFDAMRLDRGMSLYEQPIGWARLILSGASPLALQGDSNAISLLFPMEAVFESYVADILRFNLADGIYLKEQVASKSLVQHRGNSMFRLKPDMVIFERGKSDAAMVLDTKWKLIDTNKAGNYGMSQSDLYQMFAYGHKYLGGEGVLMLIYPRTEEFSQVIVEPFDFTDGDSRLTLYVVPFDLSPDVKDHRRLMVKTAAFSGARCLFK